ncbi:class C sortase [Bifidobacterium cuniculi]|uniref:Sortase n=1 Tax=Bifidobacterium cuniculi TaxID=1688 RepID=A0A087AIH4_9BIFI|nr:class C sortase [Bifidobacterium cuniculi]KFI58574.1 Sortase [Bifidobacterium cuniculi]
MHRRRKQAKVQTQPWQPLDFAQATDITDVVRLRRSLRRRMLAMRILTLLLVAAALIVGATPFVLQWKTSRSLSLQTRSVQQEVLGWPYPQAEEEIKAAQEYNHELAASGQPILGEAVDPFASASGSSSASGQGDSAADKDTRYQQLLDTGGGVMGSIRIPKIGVELPIYHGTSEEALASGAGHLYGTSLPVGGTNTHSVITGHRGLVAAPMFTRLDEMVKGDYFYVEVMGETLGYKVDRITVIDPDDTSQLRVVPGEDRVTLMTCTPYGVNTQRLLVSGTRVSIPYPAPNPSDLHDGRTSGTMAAIVTLVLGLLVCALLRRRRKGFMRVRHGRDW